VKGSLKLGPRRVLTRGEAWACFYANLALPGSGSLAAGRAVGYWQMAAAFLAVAFSVLTSIPMFQWALSGGAVAVQSPSGDPFEQLAEVWHHARWPMAGFGLFVASIFWAIMTSMAILAKAPKEAVPPRIM
jgi:hypothetical protein